MSLHPKGTSSGCLSHPSGREPEGSVAISDFFDALRSWRPYRKSLDTREVLVLMKKNAGTDFNPMLVDNFVRAFLAALAKQE